MDLQWSDGGSEARFTAYVEGLSRCLGHRDREEPFRSYCTGLLLPGDRKSVEPMAARLRPDRTAAEHQSLLHFVGQSPWDSDALLRAVRQAVLPVMTMRSPVTAWIVDDTSFPKKGDHSVGVARQYCGQLGMPVRQTRAGVGGPYSHAHAAMMIGENPQAEQDRHR